MPRVARGVKERRGGESSSGAEGSGALLVHGAHEVPQQHHDLALRRGRQARHTVLSRAGSELCESRIAHERGGRGCPYREIQNLI